MRTVVGALAGAAVVAGAASWGLRPAGWARSAEGDAIQAFLVVPPVSTAAVPPVTAPSAVGGPLGSLAVGAQDKASSDKLPAPPAVAAMPATNSPTSAKPKVLAGLPQTLADKVEGTRAVPADSVTTTPPPVTTVRPLVTPAVTTVRPPANAPTGTPTTAAIMLVQMNDTKGWSCHTYTKNQTDEWCKTAGVVDKVEYKYTAADGECGYCRCCKKTLGEAGARGLFGKLAQAREESRLQAALAKADAKYKEKEATAFAQLAKLSKCGTKPGIYAAVGSTCARSPPMSLPGVTESTCGKANFSVAPGRVFAYSMRTAGTFFAAEVKGVPGGGFQRGALLSFDASSTKLLGNDTAAAGLTKCEGCEVHAGALDTAKKAMPQVRQALAALLCRPVTGNVTCVVRVTGHGAGAMLAQLIAWELAQEDFQIGASYVFASPMVGNAAFAAKVREYFSGGMLGPLFNVVSGKVTTTAGSEPPAAASGYRASGYAAVYEGGTAARAALCLDGKCGKGGVLEQAKDGCKGPFVADGDFCTFKDSSKQCYLGWSL